MVWVQGGWRCIDEGDACIDQVMHSADLGNADMRSLSSRHMRRKEACKPCLCNIYASAPFTKPH
jgi:hypothetical protein